MSEDINQDRRVRCTRRCFLGTTAVTVAAAQLGMFKLADARSSSAEPQDVRPITPGTNTSFAAIKQIDAGLLNVGYAESGPANGPTVVLLHG
jgi:hypothetical protein